MHVEQEIEVAHPRATFEIRKTAKPGAHSLRVARILEVRDKTIIFDETFAPPVIATHAHPVVAGWIERVIGWMDTKLETLSRYAADPSSGGGLQTFDYFMLQMLNREINVVKHMRVFAVHPPGRVLQGTAADRPANSGLSRPSGLRRNMPNTTRIRSIRCSSRCCPISSGCSASISAARSASTWWKRRPTLSSPRCPTARCSATRRSSSKSRRSKPLSQVQQQFPALCKVGPNTKMNEIVQTHLPGIELVHMPTPPRQIRAVSDHVYFYLDKSSMLWPEFSVASGMGLHFAGDWPGLVLDLWAIVEERR